MSRADDGAMAKPSSPQTQFVKSFPASVPARVVVDAAASAGVPLTPDQVYAARAYARNQPALAGPASEADQAFAAAALRVGVDRARVLLDELVQRWSGAAL